MWSRPPIVSTENWVACACPRSSGRSGSWSIDEEEQAVHSRDLEAGGVRLARSVPLQRRSSEEHPLLALQRTAGNTAVAQLVSDERQSEERQSPVLDVVGKGGGQA